MLAAKLIFTACLSILSLACAQSSCRDAPFPIPLGYKCFEELPISVKNRSESYISAQDSKWVVLDVKFIETGKYGSPSFSIDKIPSDAKLNVASAWQDASRSAQSQNIAVTVPDPESGMPISFGVDSNATSNIENSARFLANIATNVAYVKISVDAPSKKDCVFGICNNISSLLEGTFQIYKMYIGTPEDAKKTVTIAYSRSDPHFLKFINDCNLELNVYIKLESQSDTGGPAFMIDAGPYIFPPGSSKLVQRNDGKGILTMRLGTGRSVLLVHTFAKSSGLRDTSGFQLKINSVPFYFKWIKAFDMKPQPDGTESPDAFVHLECPK